MDIEEYFRRIGYKNSRNKLDLETLTGILQHQIRTIPFENLNIHCGQHMDIGLEAIYDQLVKKNRGGWCLQVNYLLYWVLTTIGFETTILGGYQYITPDKKYSSTMAHLLLKVAIDDKNYIVDAGFGFSYQMWQPLELISGKAQPQVPCIFHLTEEGGYWYMDQTKRELYVPNQEYHNSDLLEKRKYRKMFSFTLTPRKIDDFESICESMQKSAGNLFTSKSFCSLQTEDGVNSLVGFTLIRRRYNYKDNMDLVEIKTLNEDEIEEELKNTFNVYLEGKLVPKNGDVFLRV